MAAVPLEDSPVEEEALEVAAVAASEGSVEEVSVAEALAEAGRNKFKVSGKAIKRSIYLLNERLSFAVRLQPTV